MINFEAEVSALTIDNVKVQRPGKKVTRGEDAIVAACLALSKGDILAIENLGGFHLAVNARNPSAIKRLKRRKDHPETKPLTLLVPDEDSARSFGVFSDEAWKKMSASPSAIGVVELDPLYDLPEEISANLGDIAICVAQLPWHKEIFAELDYDALAVTSANMYGEQRIFSSDDMLSQLGILADVVLYYDGDFPLKKSTLNYVFLDGNGDFIPLEYTREHLDNDDYIPLLGAQHLESFGRLSPLVPRTEASAFTSSTSFIIADLDDVTCGGVGALRHGGQILYVPSAHRQTPGFVEQTWSIPPYLVLHDDGEVIPWASVLGIARAWHWPAPMLDAAFMGGLADVSDEELLYAAQSLEADEGVACFSAVKLFDAASALLGLCVHPDYPGQALAEFEWTAKSWLESNRVDVLEYASIYCETLSSTKIWMNASGMSRPFFDLIHGLKKSRHSLGEAAARFHAHMAALFATALLHSIPDGDDDITCVLLGYLSRNHLIRRSIHGIMQRHGVNVVTGVLSE